MVVRQGDVWWAELPPPRGSEAGFRRPVIIMQEDLLNRSALRTALCVPLTSNQRWAGLPTTLTLAPDETGLDQASVAQAPLAFAVNKVDLTERVGRVSAQSLRLLTRCIDRVMGR